MSIVAPTCEYYVVARRFTEVKLINANLIPHTTKSCSRLTWTLPPSTIISILDPAETLEKAQIGLFKFFNLLNS